MKKIVVFVCSITLVSGILYAGNPGKTGIKPGGAEETKGLYDRIDIVGDDVKNGAFDLALEYKDSSLGWMVYTRLEIPGLLYTHLAKTTDNGKTWRFVKRLNDSIEGTIRSRKKTYRGTWVNEVPTLVYDPDDPGKEWKLYWHKYFSAEKYPKFLHRRERILTHSWIMYKYAASPEKLDSAEPVKLFGTNHAVEKARFNFNKQFKKKLYVSSYTEPASMYKDGVLYLALSWFAVPRTSEFGILFLISSDDHGKTWKFIDKIVHPVDGARLGYEHLTAASLAEDDGRVFLLISPVKNEKHFGTYIFEFDDISRGELKRDYNGKLVVHKYLPASVPVRFGGNSGESDYDKHNTHGGIIMSEIDKRLFPGVANIYNTRIRPWDVHQ